MTEETWLLMHDNPDYEVSDTGKVRNVRTGKVLVGRPTKTGYLRVNIRMNGMRKDAYIHRIVADEFCNHLPGNDVVNHIDNNVQNNSADNLEWTTALGNVHHSMKQHRCRLNARHVVGCKDGEMHEYISTRQAEHYTGCDHSTIAKCCMGKLKSTHGFTWRYAEVV